MLSPAILRRMGFEPTISIFVAGPHVVVADLQAALATTAKGRKHTISVTIDQGARVQVAVSRIETVANGASADLETDHTVSDWRFTGTVVDRKSKFHGQTVRGYISGDTADTVGDVYTQIA